MARFDIQVISGGKGVRTFKAEDRTTSSLDATLKPGDVMKRGGTGGNFATIALDGDPEIGADILMGVVVKESDETSSADGHVDIEQIGGGTVLRGKANTSGNIDTQSELDALVLDYVTFDRSAATSAGNLTIDENENDDPNVHGLQIVDGDTVKGTLDVKVHANVTMEGSLSGQTMD